ncbi:MAG: hypothetical protein WCJ35_21250 [Planctomycetota bacterium]
MATLTLFVLIVSKSHLRHFSRTLRPLACIEVATVETGYTLINRV